MIAIDILRLLATRQVQRETRATLTMLHEVEEGSLKLAAGQAIEQKTQQEALAHTDRRPLRIPSVPLRDVSPRGCTPQESQMATKLGVVSPAWYLHRIPR